MKYKKKTSVIFETFFKSAKTGCCISREQDRNVIDFLKLVPFLLNFSALLHLAGCPESNLDHDDAKSFEAKSEGGK